MKHLAQDDRAVEGSARGFYYDNKPRRSELDRMEIERRVRIYTLQVQFLGHVFFINGSEGNN